MQTITIAGIGSRETPKHILSEMVKIGEWIASVKGRVYSGHADGADWAFEQGAQSRCIAFIPWRNFNTHLTSNATLIIPPVTQKAKEITKQYHPAFHRLSEGALKLHCRNAYQILGSEIGPCQNSYGQNLPRVQAVVCWTSDGEASGGTGQAIRIAQDNNIPILNMHSDDYNTAEKVIDVLKMTN